MQEHGNWLVVDGQNSLGPAVCTDVTEKCTFFVLSKAKMQPFCKI